MSNYTLAVSWSGKDALSDSDATKVISGADFNTEFTTVQTAINSKADVNGDSGEAFSASTITLASSPSADDNTTKVATTEFVRTVIAAIYPIGSIYTSTTSTVPSDSTRLGFGTWAAFGEGKVLVGKASSGTFSSAGAEGGSETHTLTEAEMPEHDHTTNIGFDDYYTNQIFIDNSKVYTAGAETTARVEIESNNDSYSTRTGDAGSDSAHNNLQPYIVIYMWKRTG